MKLTENTILVTGGGSGIGRGLAEAFHGRGNRVIVAGRDRKKLDDVVAHHPGMVALTVDMSAEASIRELALKLRETQPALNVVIHSAGIMKIEDLAGLTTPLADVEAIVATNLLGPMRLDRELLPLLRKQPRATIMTVSSGLAFVPMAMTATYCATKAGIHSYTQSLRQQLRETSVEVLELAPPYVQTELMGKQQKSDPHAMPLQEFISEVMQILETQPEAREILVQRVHPLRFAEANGKEAYGKAFGMINSVVAHPPK